MSKPNSKRKALTIDILDNLRQFNVLNQFELLILMVKNDRGATALLLDIQIEL